MAIRETGRRDVSAAPPAHPFLTLLLILLLEASWVDGAGALNGSNTTTQSAATPTQTFTQTMASTDTHSQDSNTRSNENTTASNTLMSATPTSTVTKTETPSSSSTTTNTVSPSSSDTRSRTVTPAPSGTDSWSINVTRQHFTPTPEPTWSQSSTPSDVIPDCIAIPSTAFQTERILRKVWVLSVPTELYFLNEWSEVNDHYLGSLPERSFMLDLFDRLGELFSFTIIPTDSRTRSKIYQTISCVVDYDVSDYLPFGFDVCQESTPPCTSAVQSCPVQGVLQCSCLPGAGDYPMLADSFHWNLTNVTYNSSTNDDVDLILLPPCYNDTNFTEDGGPCNQSWMNDTIDEAEEPASASANCSQWWNGTDWEEGNCTITEGGTNCTNDQDVNGTSTNCTGSTITNTTTTTSTNDRQIVNSQRMMKLMNLIGNVQFEFLLRLEHNPDYQPCTFEDIEETYSQLLPPTLEIVNDLADKYLFDAGKVTWRYAYVEPPPTPTDSGTLPSKTITKESMTKSHSPREWTITAPLPPERPTTAVPTMSPVVVNSTTNLWPLLLLLIPLVVGLAVGGIFLYRWVVNKRYRSKVFHVYEEEEGNAGQTGAEDDEEDDGVEKRRVVPQTEEDLGPLFAMGKTLGNGADMDKLRGNRSSEGGVLSFDPLREMVAEDAKETEMMTRGRGGAKRPILDLNAPDEEEEDSTQSTTAGAKVVPLPEGALARSPLFDSRGGGARLTGSSRTGGGTGGSGLTNAKTFDAFHSCMMEHTTGVDVANLDLELPEEEDENPQGGDEMVVYSEDSGSDFTDSEKSSYSSSSEPPAEEEAGGLGGRRTNGYSDRRSRGSAGGRYGGGYGGSR